MFEAGESENIQQVNDDATEFKFSLFGAVSIRIVGRKC